MKKTYNVYNEKLPVLDSISEVFSQKEVLSFDSIAFVCIQHLLFTTFSLMKSLIQLGAPPDNIHIMGKSYSSCSQVVDKLIASGCHCYSNSLQEKLGNFRVSFIQDIERMWQAVYNDLQHKNIKLVVILDDGGACITNVPHYIREKYSVVGVEQTSSGLSALPKHPLSFPIIEVASSAAKQLIESPMIAEAVVKKLSTILPMRKESLSCGVAGLGIIGAVVTQKLLSLNHKVIAYDKNSEKGQNLGKALRATDIKAIFEGSKYIFGCTGKDITENLDITDINSAKTFISCSSQDKEFLTLLKIFEEKSCRYQNVLDHLECSLNGQTVKVYRGGFPINLDNSGESVKANDIQLTRALLLGGVLQGIVYALHYPKKKNIRYMLHPAIQSFVVGHWMNYGSTFLFSPALLEAFQDWSWIKSQSRGINQENELISRCFYYENFSIKAPILMRNYG